MSKDVIAVIRKQDNKICLITGFALCYESTKNGSFIEFEVKDLYEDELSDFISLDKINDRYIVEPQAFVQMLWLIDEYFGRKMNSGVL